MFINFLFAAIAASQDIDIQKHLQQVVHEKFQVEFEYDYHEEGEESPRHEKGVLSINKNQYRIKFLDREIICNGKKIWNLDKNSNTVNIIKEIEDDDNPLLLLINYKKFFEPEDLVLKNNSYLITMVPKNENDDDLDIKSFEIICNENFIQQLNIFNDDDSWMSIRFSHWNTKINFTKDFFFFDVKKNNIKIVELD